MLSDACGDFIATLIEGEEPANEAVKRLVVQIEGYRAASWGYTAGEIETLREAAREVLAMPSGANARRGPWLGLLVRLVVEAEQVRAYHDIPTVRLPGNHSGAR